MRLRIFPAKRSALKNAKLPNDLVENEEKTSISAEVNKVKDETFQNFSEVSKQEIIEFEDKKTLDAGFEILGDLLGFLRKQKYMSALMACRQISEICVNGKIVEIDFDEESVTETFADEKIISQINEFFAGRGLSFKFKNKEDTRNPADELNDLLGGNLVKTR